MNWDYACSDLFCFGFQKLLQSPLLSQLVVWGTGFSGLKFRKIQKNWNAILVPNSVKLTTKNSSPLVTLFIGVLWCKLLCLTSQAGGPFYPVLTGWRDSIHSYFNEALATIPWPDDNITQTLHLFDLRGFDERETVSLLGSY